MTSDRLALITALRQRLHACPELSGREEQTRAHILAFLREHTHLDVKDMGGWLLGTHWEGDGLPTVAFRADMDAIPAEGGARCARHGCGHDGHSAILCALALALEGRRTGRNVLLIFQGAEETGEGAKRICDTWSALERVSAVYALHNIPGHPKGAALLRHGCFACASEGLIVSVQGRPAHAAYPEDGANPSALLSRLVLALPGMIADVLGGGDRLLMHTVVGLRAGGRNFGISAAEGELCLTLRGHRQADIDALEAAIEAFVRRECADSGMTCGFELQDVFPDTTNDDAMTDAAAAAFERAGLSVRWLETPMRWSEDFGWFLKHRPGVYFGIGIGEDHPGLHTADYAFDDAIIPSAVAALEALL